MPRGTTAINNLYRGTTLINKLYRGGVLLWERLVLLVENYAVTNANTAGSTGITATSSVFADVRCVQVTAQIWGLAYGDGSVIRLYTSSDGGSTWTERGSYSTDRDYTLTVNFDATINRIKASWIGGATVARTIEVKITRRYVTKSL